MPLATSQPEKENLGKVDTATKRSSIGATPSSARPLPRVATITTADKRASAVRPNATTITKSAAAPTAKKTTGSTGSTISNRSSTATKPSTARTPISATTSTVKSAPDGSAKRASTGSAVGAKAATQVTPKMSSATLKRLSTQKSAPATEKGPRLAAHIKSPSAATPKTNASPLSPTVSKSKDAIIENSIGSPPPSQASKRDSRDSRLDSNRDFSPFSPGSDISGTESTHESVDMTVRKPQLAHAGASSPTRAPARPTGPRVGQPPPVSAANLATFHDARYLTPEEQRIVRAFREDPDHIVFKRLADEEDHTFGQVVEDMELHSVSQLNELTKVADERLKRMGELQTQIDRMQTQILASDTEEKPKSPVSLQDSGTMTVEVASMVPAVETVQPDPEMKADDITFFEESAVALQKEIDSLQEEINELRRTETSLHDENGRSKAQIQKLQTEIKSKDDNIALFEDSTMGLQKDIDSLQEEINELHRTETSLHDEDERNKAQIQKLQNEIRGKDASAESDQMTIIKLKHDVMNYSQDSARKSEVLERYDHELTELRQASKELEKLPNGVKGIYKQIDDLNSDNNTLRVEISGLTNVEEQLTSANTKLKAEKDQLFTEVAQLLDKIDQHHATNKNLTEEVDNLRAEVAELDKGNEELEERNDELTARNENLEVSVADLTADRSNLQLLKEELLDKVSRADTESTSLITANKDLEAQLNRLQATHEIIDSERNEMQTENQKARDKLTDLKSENQHLKADIKALQSQYDNALSQNESSAEDESWKSEKQRLERQIDLLREEGRKSTALNNFMEMEIHGISARRCESENELQFAKTRLMNAQAQVKELKKQEEYQWLSFDSLRTRLGMQGSTNWSDLESVMNMTMDSLESKIKTLTNQLEGSEQQSRSAQGDLDTQLEETKNHFNLNECKTWRDIIQALSDRNTKLLTEKAAIANENTKIQDQRALDQESTRLVRQELFLHRLSLVDIVRALNASDHDELVPASLEEYEHGLGIVQPSLEHRDAYNDLSRIVDHLKAVQDFNEEPAFAANGTLDNISGHQHMLYVLRGINQRLSHLEKEAPKLINKLSSEYKLILSHVETPQTDLDWERIERMVLNDLEGSRGVHGIDDDDDEDNDGIDVQSSPLSISLGKRPAIGRDDDKRVKFAIHEGTDDIGELKLVENSEEVHPKFRKSFSLLEEYRQELEKTDEELADARAKITQSFFSLHQELRSARELTRVDDELPESSTQAIQRSLSSQPLLPDNESEAGSEL